MEIKEFLKEDRLKYDFTHDCDYTPGGEYKLLMGYEKYFAYKSLVKVGKVKDPDSSSNLLQSIYKTLWPELESMEHMKGASRIRSDTMTSVQYTLPYYFADKFPDEAEKYKEKNPGQRFSVKMCEAMYSQYETVASNLNLKANEDLKHFISVYHTLGNYSPVPTGFNVARSGGGAYDYWDLTLMKIKNYFDLRKEPQTKIAGGINQIASLLHCEEIINCLRWLDGYESWKEFVEENFFQDYVDENWEVIPFCKGHSWENGCNKISDYDEFFRNVWTRIEKRTIKMIQALKEKVKES